MMDRFKAATKERGLSTLLYEDPDASTENYDLLKALTEKAILEPDYPIPEGYIKVKDRTPVCKY